jgi:hypothetical protein
MRITIYGLMDHQDVVGILKPSDERKRGEAFRTIKISELNETIPLDVVHSLLAALPLHTTEVCSLQGPLPGWVRWGPAAPRPPG